MTKVKLGDVAIERKQTYKGDKDNIPSVGLEHLIPSEVRLSQWDMNVDNTFTKGFTKGQILLGRRRAYLKKAVIAPFDGICSGDITIIEAIPNKIREDLLPFIIQNDRFFDYAIKGSAGSLSPRVKWEYLKDYEFDLPQIEEQERLAKLLWAAYELRESYKKLIVATDEMVKAQFIEMFGDPNINDKNWKYLPLSSITDIILGSTPSSTNPKYWDGNIKWITPAELNENSFIVSNTERKVTLDGYNSAALKLFPKGTVIFTSRAPIGKVAIAGDKMCSNQGIKSFICHKELNPVYLFAIFKLFTDYFIAMGTGSTFKELSKAIIEKVSISVPPINSQNDFEHFYKQAYKSKAELQQSIKKIDNVMKSLLP